MFSAPPATHTGTSRRLNKCNLVFRNSLILAIITFLINKRLLILSENDLSNNRELEKTMKEELRELVGALSKVYITHRKCFLQQSQKHGLYVGQPQVLNFVIRHPGCTQNEIAAALGVSAASIAFSTKRLQNAGFLQKQVNSLNMRCNKLYVTPEGKEILKEFGSGYDELNQAMFEGFSEDEIKQLADFAKRVDSNLEKFMKEEKSS